MFCIISAVFIMVLCLSVIIALNKRMIERLGKSYQTNAQLTELFTQVDSMEKSLENYFSYRTFESIDSFFHYQASSEELLYWLPESPSGDIVIQKEYVVKKLIMSLYSLSKEAVAAKRANNELFAQKKHKKSLECYAMLQSQVEELNILLMQRNAEIYSENTKSLSVVTRLSTLLLFVFFYSDVHDPLCFDYRNHQASFGYFGRSPEGGEAGF